MLSLCKKSYGTLAKGAIFLDNPVYIELNYTNLIYFARTSVIEHSCQQIEMTSGICMNINKNQWFQKVLYRSDSELSNITIH